MFHMFVCMCILELHGIVTHFNFSIIFMATCLIALYVYLASSHILCVFKLICCFYTFARFA